MSNSKMIRAIGSLGLAAMVTVGAVPAAAAQATVTSVLPTAGINFAMAEENVSLVSLQQSQTQTGTAQSAATEGTTLMAGVAGAIHNANASVMDAVKTDPEPVVAEEQPVVEIVETVPTEVTGVLVAVESTAPEAETPADAEITDTQTAETEMVDVAAPGDVEIVEDQAAEEETADPNDETDYFRNLVIAQVHDYVNVREEPNTESEIVGKLYDDSVGELIEVADDWYKITSGNVTGYVKAEYCVTGEDAIALAPEVGTRIATVNTTTLKVRAEAGMEAEVLGLVPIQDQLVVKEELDGWVRVEIEEGEGYVSSEYVILSTEFVKAESRAEEEARLAREQAEREAAQRAAAAAAASRGGNGGGSSSSAAPAQVYATGGGSATGQAVANYACQFVGNPYVYGGTSLTNGADCSGFVMSVYAHFGVSLPHSSAADRGVGRAVQGGLAGAQPGDIVCYSGHVGIYIGGGQIVHASSAKTGIKISNANYRSPLGVRRIF